MLILSRKEQESVIIQVGEVRVSVMVTRLGPEQVRLGFTAPRDVVIHRKEVFDAIDKES